MTLEQLCEGIGLQSNIQERVLRIAAALDVQRLENLTECFYDYELARNVHTLIQHQYSEDPENMILLTCMLYVSVLAYRKYEEKGIPDQVYFDTMGCYPRFLDETYRNTGRWEFDRYWWTARQAGMHLFRIGELEYEIKRMDGTVKIGIHVPSDANLSPAAVEESIHSATVFFAQYYPEVSECDYICHSWLMDPQLKQMLDKNSNIINFQNLFYIYDIGSECQDCIRWVFHTEERNYRELPEVTTLQRHLKEFFLNEGKVNASFGRLKEVPRL